MSWFKKHDVLNKTLCVLAALLLWFYVVSVQNPNMETEIRNVNIALVGREQMLENYGLSVIALSNPTVTVKVSGRREKIAQVTNEKIIATADLNSIDSPGQYTLPYQATLLVDGVSVAARMPAAVTVVVDKIITKSVPVKVDISASAAEGYFIGNYIVDPATIEIKGPQTELDLVDHAIVEFNADEPLSQNIDAKFNYRLADADGKEIVSDNITRLDESVNLEIPVGEFKEVPFVVDFADAPGIDTAYATAEISPGTIKISSDSAVLGTLNQIHLGTIDLAGKEDGSVVEMPVILPNGVQNMSGIQTVSVTIRFQGVTSKEFTVNRFEIVADSEATERYNFNVIESELAITLKGHSSVLNNITADMITIVADLRGITLEAGETVRAPVHVLVTGEPNTALDGAYTLQVEVGER